MAQRSQMRLAHIAGINVYLHWSWFLVVLYELEARAHVYSSPVWIVFEVLALFAIVTMHEFGHALACRSVGGVANRILLWPFGGIAYVDTPVRPGATLWTLAAGPLVNVVLIPILAVLSHWALASGAVLSDPNLLIFIHSVVIINIGLLIFNILPVYPLDGGQILHALLWYPLGRARSLMVATVIGLVGVIGFFLLALRIGDLWLAAITVFILLYCWNGLKQGRYLWKLSKLPRHEAFACPWCQQPPPAAPLWQCGYCAHPFDPFASNGLCPHCQHQFAQARCLDCGHGFPWHAWDSRVITVVP